MNAESLVASAAINLGLALVVLSLFSVLKKQPGNAPVYFARRIAAGEEVTVERRFSLRRLRPSVSWIPVAFRLSEEEVLRRRGLDALVVLRLFKLGIKLFTVCSVVGLLILVPVNYTCQQDPSSVLSHTMDSFTISNIRQGSDRLWVHFSCLCFISFYVTYLLHKEYKSILKLRILQIGYHRQHPDQFTVLVRGIPLCTEHEARGCSVDHFFSKYYPFTYQSYQIVHDGENIEELLNLASSFERKIKKLRQKSFPKCNLGHWLCSKFRSEFTDVAAYEESLKEVCQRIRLLQCDNILKHKELPVAFVSFKSRLGAALAVETQQHVNPLLWITEFAPGTNDILWHNLAIPYRRLAVHRIGAFIAAVFLIIFFAFPVTAVQGIVQFEKVKKWFPPARAVQLIPGLNSILTGYLPSAILNGFIYLIPYAMLGMASLEGCVSKSKRDIKACSMVFYFLVGNVFFFSLLSGSLLDQIGESFAHPKDFPSRLASAVSAQSDFFITYILTDGMSGFSLEVLQLGLLSWHFMKAHSFGQGTKEEPYLYGFPYYRVVPIVSLAILIGMVYAVIAPLLLPFLIIYFLLGYAVYVNQMQDVYEIVYDTCGQYWPYIHHYIFITVVLMQITMIGFFGLKSKPGASFSTVPLLVLNCLFNEYCKIRFLPTFCHRPVQNAKDNDNLDEMEGHGESNQESRISAYQPPWMRPAANPHAHSNLEGRVKQSHIRFILNSLSRTFIPDGYFDHGTIKVYYWVAQFKEAAAQIQSKTIPMEANKNVSAQGSNDAHEVQIEEILKTLKSINAKNIEDVDHSKAQHRLQKVPELLRKNKEQGKPFDPVIVAIGPYHHSDPRLADMEDHKKAATYAFANKEDHKMDEFYKKVAAVTQEARKLYVDELLPAMGESDFTRMLLFDGCFVLQFIDQLVNGKPEDLSMSYHLHGFILRDMFLLENQIPYVVLEALMGVKRVDIDKFLDMIVGTESKGNEGGGSRDVGSGGGKHAHLLAHLREKHLGKADEKPDLDLLVCNRWQTFRSATEISSVGIKLCQSSSRHMRDVRFESFFVWGKLTLPRMVVDDLTRSRLLNMVALEMCPGAVSDYGITSFLWLLDCLIDHADDVKELRKKGILLNALGSDEQVAELFNEIATDLAPDQQAYKHVLEKIASHLECKTKVSIYHLIDTHFSSPWTAISFFAAVVLLILTLLQTIYTMRG